MKALPSHWEAASAGGVGWWWLGGCGGSHWPKRAAASPLTRKTHHDLTGRERCRELRNSVRTKGEKKERMRATGRMKDRAEREREREESRVGK